MNKGLIYKTIKNRKITIVMVILAVILGFYSYYVLPKQESPDVSAPIAMIKTIYPGASPEEVEKLVTKKIEDNITEMEGYDYSHSFSKNSVSIVLLYLDYGTETDKAWPDLRREMDDLQKDLPEGCWDIEVDTDLVETAGMIISLSGDNYTYEQLAAFAENLEQDLAKIDGVSRFDIDGKLEKEVKVEVDIAKLNQYELSMEDLLNLLKMQNIEIPSGAIENEEIKINVKTPGLFTSLKNIEDTIVNVSRETGAVVRLKDLAKVYWDLEDSSYKIKQNGKNAVLLTGYFQDNKNVVITGKDVREKLDEFKNSAPEDLSIDEVIYQPNDVNSAVGDFIHNLLAGILLVVIVVFLGMGFKNAIVVSTAIPLSILMSFIVMYILKIKVHQISITALIIALGILVDNAIVISDAIQVLLDQGVEKMEACIRGARETAIPIFTSTLTTVAAFTPLFFVPGPAGEYLKSIPQVVIISLIASFIAAMFVMPGMAYIFFEKTGVKQEKTSFLRRFFTDSLHQALGHKKKTVLLATIIFGLSIYLIPYLGLRFFPHADKNIIYIDIESETAADIDKTEKVVKQVEAVLEEQKEITGYTSAIGDGLPKFYITMPVATPSQDFAQIKADVNLEGSKEFKNNEALTDYLQGKLDSTVVGGTTTVKLLEQAFPYGDPVQIRVTGDNMDRLEEVSREFQDILREIPGTTNVTDDAEDKTYEFMLDVDEDIANNYGISKYDIQRQINIALKGAESSTFRKAGNEYDIVVTSNIKSKEDLENLAIKSSIAGNKVLLKQIAEVTLSAQRQTVKKYDGELAVTASSGVKPGYSSADIEAAVKDHISEINLDGVSYVFDGEQGQITKNFSDLAKGAGFALFFIYIILMIQFNSFAQPFVIFLTIPLALIGSVVGLFLFRQALSFTAFLGIVSLVGLVIKNAILLIEVINTSRDESKTLEEACISAVDRRLRPIVLSAITTIMGLVPLAFSGSSLFEPMSVTLMFGLLASTFLTLVVIPVVYTLVQSLGKKSIVAMKRIKG